MKKLFKLLLVSVSCFLFACEKDLEQKVLVVPASIKSFSTTSGNLILSEAAEKSNVVTFQFAEPEYGVNVSKLNTLQFDVPSDTAGLAAWGKAIEFKLPLDSTSKTFTGKDLNSLLVNQMKLPTGTPSTIVVRLKSEVTQPTGATSQVKPLYSTLTMTVTPYKAEVIYPALLFRGGGGWQTPADRSPGFILTSANFNSKYEGFVYLPNTNGWGGDGFKLESTTSGTSYGWASATTIAAGASGDIWITPAPNYMKINVDLDALTISATPVTFYISGDFNNWSTSATPMTYNPATKKLEANNVSLTANTKFAFIANQGWDISYKVDKEGAIRFAGPPYWGNGGTPNDTSDDLSNINVPQTGTFKVTLDLSQGDGKYTYSIE